MPRAQQFPFPVLGGGCVGGVGEGGGGGCDYIFRENFLLEVVEYIWVVVKASLEGECHKKQQVGQEEWNKKTNPHWNFANRFLLHKLVFIVDCDYLSWLSISELENVVSRNKLPQFDGKCQPKTELFPSNFPSPD